MNINDVQAQEVQGDRLNAIFARQRELVEKYKEIEGMPADFPFNPHSRVGQKWFKDFAWRMTEEIAEAIEALDHEDEANEEGNIELASQHRAHYNEELADALHFLVENLILVGITPEQLAGEIPEEFGDLDKLGYVFTIVDATVTQIEDEADQCPSISEAAMDVVVELGKAMNCLKNKPWKQTEVLTDVNKFHECLIGTFFSFIALLVWSGLDAEDVTDLYFRKSEVNKFRQRSKY